MVTGLAAQPVVYLVDQPQRRPAGCSRRSVLIIKSSLQSLVDRTTVLAGCSQLLHPNLRSQSHRQHLCLCTASMRCSLMIAHQRPTKSCKSGENSPGGRRGGSLCTTAQICWNTVVQCMYGNRPVATSNCSNTACRCL